MYSCYYARADTIRGWVKGKLGSEPALRVLQNMQRLTQHGYRRLRTYMQ